MKGGMKLNVIKNKKGFSYVQTAVVVLCLALVLSVVILYAGIMSIIQNTRENARRALDDYITEQSIQIYDNLKNGNNNMPVIEEDFTPYFILNSTFDKRGELLYSVDKDGKTVFWTTLPIVEYTAERTLNLTASYDIYVPMGFAGKHVADLKIPVEVKAKYARKY